MSENKNQPRNSMNPIRVLLHIPVPWVFVLVYLVGVVLQFLFPFDVHSPTVLTISRSLGVLLFVMGAVIAGWGLFIFHKARTTTVPGEASAELVMQGPYRFSRNPMYLGLTLAYLGEAGLLTQIWPILLLFFTLAYVNWMVIPLEEARLKEVFGDKYQQYCAKVHRWI
jgi:protein-S-isoprenylcysteine O-methyltransferase Ste14